MHSTAQKEITQALCTEEIKKVRGNAADCKCFCVIGDQGTDVSNDENLSLGARVVDESFSAHKCFLSF